MATFIPKVMRILRINHLNLISKVSPSASALQKCSFHDTKSRCSDESGTAQATPAKTKSTAKAVSISRAMRAYMTRVKAHNDMMAAEVADFEIGKRHLANIMGADPDSFTQEDVDKAIEYLLPSGLFDKRARPVLKDPYEIFPKRKAAQFGLDGRPYHFMYFTSLPNYYDLLYQITWKMEDLKETEDQLRASSRFQEEVESGNDMILTSSEWITENAFRSKLLEKIGVKEYNHFLVLMERLASHPLASKEEEFIMGFRKDLMLQSETMLPPSIEVDSEGRAFSVGKGFRKRASAKVTVYKPGTGKFTINGQDLSFFSNLLYRETVAVPLIVTGLLGHVDVVAEAEMINYKGYTTGPTGQAGAIRGGLSQALQSYVDDATREKLRIAGLLTTDPRTKERKKPGQEKARKKFTWLKR